MNTSQLDFMAGQMAERRNSAAQERIDDEAIAQWRTLSKRLQDRLSKVEQDAIDTKAMLAARDAQQRALRDVLSSIAPNHPILKQIRAVGEAAQVETYRAHGYQLDLVNNTIQKI